MRKSIKNRESFRDRIRKRAKERGSGNRNIKIPEGVEFYKVKKGSSRLDIIPYAVTKKNLGYAEPGELWYERTFYMHYKVGGGNASCVCPTTFDKKCPICEYAAELGKQNSPEEQEIKKSLRPKMRQIFNVVDKQEPEKGVQIMETAFFNFGKELEKELNETETENPEYGEFASLENGYTLKIRWDEESQAGSRSYIKAGRIDFIERKKPYKESVLDSAVDLDNALMVLSYEEIEQLFNGVENEEDVAPKKTKNNFTVEDEEEDEEDTTVMMVDEEEGKKRSKRVKNKVEIENDDEYDDDDDEDEVEEYDDDDDEDEEENPVKKSKNKKLKCPVKRGVFGEDFDEYEDCEDCDLRKACKKKCKELS
jgi:hypothetical protein